MLNPIAKNLGVCKLGKADGHPYVCITSLL